MIINDSNGLGLIEISTIPLPKAFREISATYTYSGKMLLSYKTKDDPEDPDYFHIAVAKDDGTELHDIFSGVIRQHKKANGIRYMPFQDNKRVLLGDYMLECTPDIDHCQKAELIPVKYPWLLPANPLTMKHWSEIIIAPDNEHICWTILRTDIGAASAIGTLKRKKDKYIIRKPKVISTVDFFRKDKKNRGYLLPQPMRGGEIKQFVKGGTAISLAGAKESGLPNSVVQDLDSENLTQITNVPGYEETTIFSPDERLGIVMSTRGSAKTNCAIIGLMPKPHSIYTTQGIIMPVYMHAVAGVRSFRQGNIGPVLIDIGRSMHEEGYQGVQLNDPQERWVYCSPMSWCPDGMRAMWPEILRSSISDQDGVRTRIRRVELHDYQPEPAVPFVRTPDCIPYALSGLRLWLPIKVNVAGKIAGKHSGHMEYRRTGRKSVQAMMGRVEAQYINYSDDGKTFYHGTETVSHAAIGESCYEANIEMTGEKRGEMKFRLTFSPVTGEKPARLLFDKAEDGKPKSYGFASYENMRLNVEDMIE